MRLFLVRHGRTPSNVNRLLDTAYPGADLDEVGRQQAEELVGRLTGQHLDGLYASDLIRAQQTAQPLAADRGLDVTVLGGLREIQAGVDEMSPDWRRYVDALTAWAADWSVRVPGGENAYSFYARYDAAVARVASAGHESALVVSHGAALRMWIAARVRGIDVSDVIGRRLGNTTVVGLEGNPDAGWTYVSWDEVADHEAADAAADQSPARG